MVTFFLRSRSIFYTSLYSPSAAGFEEENKKNFECWTETLFIILLWYTSINNAPKRRCYIRLYLYTAVRMCGDSEKFLPVQSIKSEREKMQLVSKV